MGPPILGRLKQIILAAKVIGEVGLKMLFGKHIKTSNRLKASLKRPFSLSLSLSIPGFSSLSL